MSFFHTHVHSHYSCLDAMPSVQALVCKAARLGQPAMALTDHGNMSGSLQLYKQCKTHDILPFPGEEFYIKEDLSIKEGGRFHVTMLALSHDGYRALVNLSSISHLRENFHRKPLIDYSILAEFGDAGMLDEVALLTGCYFGMPVQAMVETHDVALAKSIIRSFASWCPNTYVELQHHDTPRTKGHDDDTIISDLCAIADEIGLPTIITQDAHYSDYKSRYAHNFYKAIASWGDPQEAIFPGDSYHLSSAAWVREHVGDKVWQRSEPSYKDLLSKHTLAFPALDTYKFHVPAIAKTPHKKLSNLCKKALLKKHPRRTRDRVKYQKRLTHELEVIKDLGMADYFLLVDQICEWCEDYGWWFNARGSANGSLVCYLLGITDIDPIEWDLLFERFLTKDRTKPPDIDLDMEPDARSECVTWLQDRFGFVFQQGTFSSLRLNEDGTGSLWVQYMAAKRRQNDLPMAQNIWALEGERPDDFDMMCDLHERELKKAPGAHAAGFILGTKEQPISDYLPTMLIPSSGNTVTQMTMDDVEDAGFVKIDLLGQRTLTTIKRIMQLIQDLNLPDTPKRLDEIPLDDKQTLQMLHKGVPDCGVFQFEGYTTAGGMHEMKPRNTKECIDALALYRPATMHSGYKDKYLECRKKRKGNYPHEIFERSLKETYGVSLFQEQVMAVLRDLGMSPEELNQFLSAVKVKHSSKGHSNRSDEIFKDHRQAFESRCKAVGMDRDAMKQAWEIIEGFAAYGFNRSHATAYGLLAYRMAYLKCYFPLEFMAGLLETTAGTHKEEKYVKEARRLSIALLPPDVNISGVSWTLDRKLMGVRKGLVSIKGVGTNAAMAIIDGAPYQDLEDLIHKVPARAVTGGAGYLRTNNVDDLVGTMNKLRGAGAFHSLGVSHI